VSENFDRKESKVIAALEFDMAKALKDSGEKLTGVYPENPKIAIASPTISRIVAAFENVYVVFIYSQNRLIQVVPPQLNDLQKKSFNYWDFLTTYFSKLLR